MNQWRRFQFFEDRSPVGPLADALAQGVRCGAGGRGRLAVGTESGSVLLLDRSLQVRRSFVAHEGPVAFLHLFKQRSCLLTVGKEARGAAVVLWDLDKAAASGVSSGASGAAAAEGGAPALMRTFNIFSDAFPAAQITACAIREAPQLGYLLAVGLATGAVDVLLADSSMRIKRLRIPPNSSQGQGGIGGAGGVGAGAGGEGAGEGGGGGGRGGDALGAGEGRGGIAAAGLGAGGSSDHSPSSSPPAPYASTSASALASTAENLPPVAVTGLGFRILDSGPQLFIVTGETVTLYTLPSGMFGAAAEGGWAGRGGGGGGGGGWGVVLEERGGDVFCSAMTDTQDLVVARPEAFYCAPLTPAASLLAPLLLLCEGGAVVLLSLHRRGDGGGGGDAGGVSGAGVSGGGASAGGGGGGGVTGGGAGGGAAGGGGAGRVEARGLLLVERDMAWKLEALFRKGLYSSALDLVVSQGGDTAATAEVLRRYGDHLYAKQDYEEAMGQYERTIGQVEPSYVIQRYLHAQRLRLLARYLERLHDKGVATPDHTTLLINCFSRLKDVSKLDAFVRAGFDAPSSDTHSIEPPTTSTPKPSSAPSSASTLPLSLTLSLPHSSSSPALPYDPDTVIQVCCSAGYYNQALFVAQRAAKHSAYLKILVEDLHRYADSLAFISALADRAKIVSAAREYGPVLAAHLPEETISLFLELCTGFGSSRDGGGMGAGGVVGVGTVSTDPVRWAERRMLLGQQKEIEAANSCNNSSAATNSSFIPPSPTSITSPPAAAAAAAAGTGASGEGGGGRGGIVSPRNAEGNDRAACLAKAGALLRAYWQQQSAPRYDADLALLTCQVHALRAGPIFLYERMRLFKEALAMHMREGDSKGLIAAHHSPSHPSSPPTLFCSPPSQVHGFRDGLLFLYERMRLFKEALAMHMREGDSKGLIAACKRLGDAGRGGDPSVWADVVRYLGERGEACGEEVAEVLSSVERGNLLPPLLVLQTLSRNPHITVGEIRDYVSRHLQQETATIEEDRRAIEKYQHETDKYRKELHQLLTEPLVFQSSRCAECNSPLDLPAVHFFCLHAFHLRCLADPTTAVAAATAAAAASMAGDVGGVSGGGGVMGGGVGGGGYGGARAGGYGGGMGEAGEGGEEGEGEGGEGGMECPKCAASYRVVREMRVGLRQSAADHDRFFQELHDARDGFGVVALYFGRGLVRAEGDLQ
ncbi:unnamed protein product [Closterium sp. Naga37s-1]|nr:unnamed protein product [Closterium sp. Naga37s-1]